MKSYLLEYENILKLDDENFSDVEILDPEIALKKDEKKMTNEWCSILCMR
jgi:hypothetical protein